jgi:T3SS EscN ATPase C-terminal domain
VDRGERGRDVLLLLDSLTRYAYALREIGTYQAGNNPRIDRAVRAIETLRAFLRQSIEDQTSMDDALAELRAMAEGFASPKASAPAPCSSAQAGAAARSGCCFGLRPATPTKRRPASLQPRSPRHSEEYS